MATGGRAPAVDRRGLALGVMLVGVGLYALLSRELGWRGPGPVLLVLGGILLALSAMSQFRGPLLPAGVLLGLGAGFVLRGPLERWLPHWSSILLGLGAGFLLVAAIDQGYGRRRQPPPVVPGIVLTGIALAEAALRGFSLEGILARQWDLLWPFAVLAAGLLLLFRAWKGRRA